MSNSKKVGSWIVFVLLVCLLLNCVVSLVGCSAQGSKTVAPAEFELVGEQDGTKVYMVRHGTYRFYLVKSGEHVAVTNMR